MRGKNHVLVTCGVDIIGMKFTDIKTDLQKAEKPMLVEFKEDRAALNSWGKEVPVATYSRGKGKVWRVNKQGHVFGGTEEKPSQGTKVLYQLGENVRDFGIIEQVGDRFVALTRCAPKAGFKCRMEFHNVEKRLKECKCKSTKGGGGGKKKSKGSRSKPNKGGAKEESCYEKNGKIRTQPTNCPASKAPDPNEPWVLASAEKYPFGTLVCVCICPHAHMLVPLSIPVRIVHDNAH